MNFDELNVFDWIKFAVIGVAGTLAGVLLISFIGAEYDVWKEGKVGEAEFARAEANRKIRILEAEAVKESAKALSEAEIIRAEGVAKANKIIGTSLDGNEGYLRYLWIQTLNTNNKEIVYVPTEANLPILEAGKRK